MPPEVAYARGPHSSTSEIVVNWRFDGKKNRDIVVEVYGAAMDEKGQRHPSFHLFVVSPYPSYPKLPIYPIHQVDIREAAHITAHPLDSVAPC